MLLLFCSFVLGKKSTFEGKVILKYQHSKDKGTTIHDISMMEFLVKDPFVKTTVTDLANKENQPDTWIIDKQSRTYQKLVNISGSKRAMKFNIDAMLKNEFLRNEIFSEDNYSYSVTAETKEIQGYICTQIIFNTEEEKGIIWVSRKLSLNFEEFMPLIKGKSFMIPPDELGGMILEYVRTNRATGAQDIMKVELIDQPIDDAMFDLPEGTDLMDMTRINSQPTQNGGSDKKKKNK